MVNDLGSAVDGSGASTSAAQAVVDEITAAGGTAIANADSVATDDGGAAIVAAAMDAFGRVDVLVNNAGILRDAAFKNMTADQVDAVIAVHLSGAFNTTRAVWPVMREQNYGRIVQTTSGTGLFGNFGQANYGAAKMGLVGMMHVLAIEGARNGIAINAIAPIARTRMTEDIMGEAGKAMDPELVTPVVVYLSHRTVTAPRTSIRWVPGRSRGCSSASRKESRIRPSQRNRWPRRSIRSTTAPRSRSAADPPQS